MMYLFKRENRTYCTEAQSLEEAAIKLFNILERCPEDRKAFTTKPFELITKTAVASTAEAQELCNGYRDRQRA